MSEEIVDVVDEQNNVVAQFRRKKVRGENLRHRATFIFVFVGGSKSDRMDEQLVVQKRTAWKDYCPSHWDACTGGVLTAGEEHLPSARRELEEELGINGATLWHMFDFLYEDDKTKVWGGAFGCRYEGSISELKLQESEVAAVEVMSVREIMTRSQSEPFTADSMYALDLYLKQ
eukprot:comp41539_c0_seq1/m.47445 comp41539_c0_seq1/g.47445  ORF comp41539_c0_seq1/g.47445 comp41539_c0_seq1/m.47445 type:complete len:174 (-) comp41539_c0_seq1:21-542(-)